MATLIVGGLAVASVTVIGSAASTRVRTSEHGIAMALAEDLMSEIMGLDYEDPTDASGLIGTNSGEQRTTDRLTLDDVDDYHKLGDMPVTRRDGTRPAGTTGYGRDVDVEFVKSTDPDATTAGDDGLKRITVSVSKGRRNVATLVMLKSRVSDRTPR